MEGGPEGPRRARCSSEEAACPVAAPCTAEQQDQAVTLHSLWLGAWAPPHPWGITNRGRGDKVTGDTQKLSRTQIVQQGHSQQGCTGGTLGSPLTASLPAECRQVINAAPNETLRYERERPPLPRHFQHHGALCTPCCHLPKQAHVLMGDMETHLSQNGQYLRLLFFKYSAITRSFSTNRCTKPAAIRNSETTERTCISCEMFLKHLIKMKTHKKPLPGSTASAFPAPCLPQTVPNLAACI